MTIRPPRVRARLAFVTFLGVLASAPPARAGDVQVAVAANFAHPMERIAADFERETGHHAVVATGATGAFFAQIERGAPFEVLLAADRSTPERLERDGYAVPGTRRTYAIGTLVLWSAKPGYVDADGAVLHKAPFQHLAVANPKLAPYGVAAMETMAALGVAGALRPRLVEGESVAQAYQFVATGNAEVGFVALSQIVVPGGGPAGSYWVVPEALHAPIAQDAVVLRRGAGNPAASALERYLETPGARAVIQQWGYRPAPSLAR